MYAILQQGGHQYRVEPGDRLLVERLPADVGSVIALEPVLLLHDGTSATVDATTVAGARVAAMVVAHRRGKKLRVFKYKPKKRYRRTLGYRSDLTELRVESFLKQGDAMPEARPVEVKAPKPSIAEVRAAAKATAKAASAAEGARAYASTSVSQPQSGSVTPSAAAVPGEGSPPHTTPSDPGNPVAHHEAGPDGDTPVELDETPAARTPDAQDPEAQEPDAQEPEVEEPEVEEPDDAATITAPETPDEA